MIDHKQLYGHRNNLSDTNQSTIQADSRFSVPKQLCSDSTLAVVESIESTYAVCNVLYSTHVRPLYVTFPSS